MFGLFNNKKYQPTVTPEDKDWIEKNIIWFIEVFGIDRLNEQPFILPNSENFPYDNLKDIEQFQHLFEQLCGYWDVNPNEVEVKFYDDLKSKQWMTWIPQGAFDEPNGLYSKVYTKGTKFYCIELAKSNLDYPELLVTVIAHELAHVKLLGGNIVNETDSDMEPLTDLATIFFGFGVFFANSIETKNIYWVSRSGYLPNQVVSYANALICYITEHDSNKYIEALNSNTKGLFKQDYDFLSNTQDTTLTKYQVLESVGIFNMLERISDGFEKRNFDNVIAACNELLELKPNDAAACNNIGYALLQQKKYQEAISQFTKAITIDPYWDYPYNNRGYCQLQLGDIANAFLDLHSSFEMNPYHSFSWRNFGAYYLTTKEFEKALHHFEEAEKIDPKTELINFYLGKAHLIMGNADKSNEYLNKSVQLNEYNDSMIE